MANNQISQNTDELDKIDFSASKKSSSDNNVSFEGNNAPPQNSSKNVSQNTDELDKIDFNSPKNTPTNNLNPPVQSSPPVQEGPLGRIAGILGALGSFQKNSALGIIDQTAKMGEFGANRLINAGKDIYNTFGGNANTSQPFFNTNKDLFPTDNSLSGKLGGAVGRMSASIAVPTLAQKGLNYILPEAATPLRALLKGMGTGATSLGAFASPGEGANEAALGAIFGGIKPAIKIAGNTYNYIKGTPIKSMISDLADKTIGKSNLQDLKGDSQLGIQTNVNANNLLNNLRQGKPADEFDYDTNKSLENAKNLTNAQIADAQSKMEAARQIPLNNIWSDAAGVDSQGNVNNAANFNNNLARDVSQGYRKIVQQHSDMYNNLFNEGESRGYPLEISPNSTDGNKISLSPQSKKLLDNLNEQSGIPDWHTLQNIDDPSEEDDLIKNNDSINNLSSYDKFVKSPSLKNAHFLQSDLNKVSNKLLKVDPSVRNSQQNSLLHNIPNVRQNIQNSIQSAFEKNGDDDLGQLYNNIGQSYKNNVVPFYKTGRLWTYLDKGKRGDIPNNISSDLLKDSVDNGGSENNYQKVRDALQSVDPDIINRAAVHNLGSKAYDGTTGNIDPDKFIKSYGNSSDTVKNALNPDSRDIIENIKHSSQLPSYDPQNDKDILDNNPEIKKNIAISNLSNGIKEKYAPLPNKIGSNNPIEKQIDPNKLAANYNNLPPDQQDILGNETKNKIRQLTAQREQADLEKIKNSSLSDLFNGVGNNPKIGKFNVTNIPKFVENYNNLGLKQNILNNISPDIQKILSQAAVWDKRTRLARNTIKLGRRTIPYIAAGAVGAGAVSEGDKFLKFLDGGSE